MSHLYLKNTSGTAGSNVPGDSSNVTVIEDVSAVLFDKDGTLIEFNTMWTRWLEQFVETLQKNEPSFEKGRSTFLRWIGWDEKSNQLRPNSCLAIAPTREVTAMAAGAIHGEGQLPWDVAWQIVETTQKEVEADFPWEELTKAVPGTLELLKELKEADVPIVLVTADTRDRALQDMEQIGALDYFDLILGDDCVEISKPAPDMVEVACERLGLSPDEVVVVGDTTSDMRMAQAAGVKAGIGVLTGSASRADLESVADYVIDSVASISLSR